MTKEMKSLVDRIADGSTRLLSADDICEKLSISRSTFDRWVKNSANPLDALREPVKPRSLFTANKANLFPDNESSTSFPQPDIRIGGSPRWDIETFKKWLSSNLTQRND